MITNYPKRQYNDLSLLRLVSSIFNFFHSTLLRRKWVKEKMSFKSKSEDQNRLGGSLPKESSRIWGQQLRNSQNEKVREKVRRPCQVGPTEKNEDRKADWIVVLYRSCPVLKVIRSSMGSRCWINHSVTLFFMTNCLKRVKYQHIWDEAKDGIVNEPPCDLVFIG